MEFSLRASHAHGTCAIRTHLDSIPPQDRHQFSRVPCSCRRLGPAGIDLQAACLIGCDYWTDNNGPFGRTADLVRGDEGRRAGHGHLSQRTICATASGVSSRKAEARGLDADFHVDETMDASVETLRDIAELKMETRFSWARRRQGIAAASRRSPRRARWTRSTSWARAGHRSGSLPMCNLYLQDRHAPGQRATPRPPRHHAGRRDARARHPREPFASDNTAIPSTGYGDMDMLEGDARGDPDGSSRPCAQRLGDELPDRPGRDLRLRRALACRRRAPPDLVISKARNWTELFARPRPTGSCCAGASRSTAPCPITLNSTSWMRT